MIDKKHLKNISILYVEDDTNIREFTSKLLEFLFKKVFVAANGEQGIQVYNENRDDIDLIITDIKMPKTDGLEMSKKIKEINENIPIIVTTAYNSSSFFVKAIDAGISYYTMKPVDLYKLISIILSIIQANLIKKEILKKELHKQENTLLLKDFINTYDNPVLIYNKSKLLSVNDNLLDFLEVSSMEEFHKKYENLYELFEDDFGFTLKEVLSEKNDYLKHLINLSQIEKTIKINNDIFTINHSNADDLFVISLTKLSQISKKNLNL